MGHYYADERDEHVLCEPQKNGLAGTAMTKPMGVPMP